MKLTKNFNSSEFYCKCGECLHGEIDRGLVDKLQLVRDGLGESMTITSGWRCPAYNTIVGGSQFSSHLTGKAADIYCPSSAYRYDILNLLIHHFTRIGIASDFLHVDVDEEKAQNVMWTY